MAVGLHRGDVEVDIPALAGLGQRGLSYQNRGGNLAVHSQLTHPDTEARVEARDPCAFSTRLGPGGCSPMLGDSREAVLRLSSGWVRSPL